MSFVTGTPPEKSGSAHSSLASRKSIAVPRQHSSFSVEDLLIGAVLPAVGLVMPHDAAPTRSHDEARNVGRGLSVSAEKQQRGSQSTGEKQTPPPLPPCDPIPIKFSDICVDVKVQDVQPGVKVPWTDKVLSFMGLGGGGSLIDKRILFGVSGEIKPYRLVALMGASGAGKSTLLNVLSKRIHPSEGAVTYAGVVPTDAIVQRNSAFVQQLDLFINNLTVHEHLYSQIRLRLPRSTSKAARLDREEILCNQMSLVKCRNNPIGTASGIGGISGGERKRLNVASEIATLPPVLFADEPTTGLDSFMADSVVSVLKNMANSGRTVIATVHQPSSKIFDKFDELLLLAEGRLLYFGDRLGCIEWLKNLGFECPPFTNPADFIIKVISMPEQPDLRDKKLAQIIEWSEKWKKEGAEFLRDWLSQGRERFLSHAQSFAEAAADAAFTKKKERSGSFDIRAKESNLGQLAADQRLRKSSSARPDEVARALDVPLEQRPGWFEQLGILYTRAINANKRDKFLVHARALQTVFLALVFGFLSFRLSWSMNDAKTKLGGLYSLMLNQSMAGAFSVITTFTFEKPVIRREHESGLISASAYMTAKMLADAPIQIVFPIIFCTLGYWLMGLNDDFGRFVVVVLIILLVSNAAMSVGYFASSVASGLDVAAVICNLCILPLTIFGGFMVKLDESPVWLNWVQYLSFVKYGFATGLVTVFRGETIIDGANKIDGLDFIGGALGISDSIFAMSFVMLVVLLVVYRSLGILAFSFIMRRSKENV